MWNNDPTCRTMKTMESIWAVVIRLPILILLSPIMYVGLFFVANYLAKHPGSDSSGRSDKEHTDNPEK